MKQPRRKHSAAFKAKVALVANRVIGAYFEFSTTRSGRAKGSRISPRMRAEVSGVGSVKPEYVFRRFYKKWLRTRTIHESAKTNPQLL